MFQQCSNLEAAVLSPRSQFPTYADKMACPGGPSNFLTGSLEWDKMNCKYLYILWSLWKIEMKLHRVIYIGKWLLFATCSHRMFTALSICRSIFLREPCDKTVLQELHHMLFCTNLNGQIESYSTASAAPPNLS